MSESTRSKTSDRERGRQARGSTDRSKAERRFVPPDVPPLSDLSRQRIRQAVFDRLDREPAQDPPAPVAAPAPSRRRPVLLALGAAAALAVGWLAVRGWSGEHRVARAPAPSPSRLQTGDSPSRVTVGDARITAGPHAALTVSEAGDAGVTVFIERGAIEFAVSPRGARPPFVVMAADVRVEVVGTEFTVTRDGDRIAVSVAEGVVRVIRAGEAEAQVAAGQSWPPAAEPSPVDDSEEEAELTFEPQVAGTPRAKRKQAEQATAPPPPAPTPRERYEAAARVEKSRPDQALATYRALAAEGGPWAGNALFAQGRLELELGRKDAARRSLGAYLKRYPRGANAGLARALLDGTQ